MEKGDEKDKSIEHPIFKDRQINIPSKGKLKWLGGNLGLAYPVLEHVIDDTGKYLELSLGELLPRIYDFEGYRGKMTVSNNLLDCCFDAYKYGLLTIAEKLIFEKFVRSKISIKTPFEAARAILLHH